MRTLPRAPAQWTVPAGDPCGKTAWSEICYGAVGLRTRREAVHDDGHVEHTDRHDIGHGAYRTSSRRVSGAGDSRVHKVPPLVIERQSPGSAWLLGLRVYLGIAFIGNLVWEILHLPLYTIWITGGLREQAFAAGHCTLGDLLIAVSTLMLALLLAGDRRWPRVRFWQIGRASCRERV